MVIIVLIVLSAFFCFVCLPFYHSIKGLHETSASANALSCVSFDDDTGILNLRDFHPNTKKFIKMKNHKIASIGYHPESYTYTSVTVGGVTTGGVTKNDGYTYISSLSDTDRYELLYKNSIIRRIRLCSDKVKMQAKQMGLEEYMDKDGYIVVVSNVEILATMEEAKAAIAGFTEDVQRKALPGYPTETKCRRIYDFVCHMP